MNSAGEAAGMPVNRAEKRTQPREFPFPARKSGRRTVLGVTPPAATSRMI
jgi:hypothetical protein